MVLPPRQRRWSRRAWLGAACAFACLALLATPMLTGLAEESRRAQDAAAQAALDERADALRIATGRGILEGSLGPRLSALLAPAYAAPGASATASAGLGALLDGAGASDRPRLAVPAAPAGPDPLLQALRSYGAEVGQPMPEAGALRPAIAALRLDPEAESALARLVLAYTQALRLQAAATAALDPLERAVIQGDDEALSAWSEAKGGRELDQALMDLAARVDQGQLLQAGDLLARTIDEVRLPLSRSGHASSHAGAASREAFDPDPWGTTREVVSIMRGGQEAPATKRSASLDEALRGLLEAYGASPAPLAGPSVALPASLDQAIASLVDAQAQGARGADPGAQAAAILAATEAAQPTLQAWGALLQPSADGAATDRLALLSALLTPSPSPSALAASSVGLPGPAPLQVPPLATLLAQAGLPATDAARAAASLPANVAAALAVVLAAEGELADAHGRLLEGLPADQAWAVAATPAVAGLLRQQAWTAQEAALVQDWAEGLAALDPDALRQLRQAQVGAVRAVEVAATLLAPSTAPGPAMPSAASVAGVDVPTGVATALAPCVPSDLSYCDQDVYLALDVGGGILVTGERSTRIDSFFFGGSRTAQITIDLGGDDEYLAPAGAARVGLGLFGVTVDPPPASGLDLPPSTVAVPFSQDQTQTAEAVGGGILGVAIDMGGHDSYTSQEAVAQGAGLGIGAVGILWDMDGDDQYLQSPDDEQPVPQASQGFGGFGGVGLLVDHAGSDTYTAFEALAQGVGLSPVFSMGPSSGAVLGGAFPARVAGIGLLLDLGQGSDRLEARAGQGHGDGFSTVGVLLDEQGATSYNVRTPSSAYQGGRGSNMAFGAAQVGDNSPIPLPGGQLGFFPGGLAALVDMGGVGDSYSTPPFPSMSGSIDTSRGMAFFASPTAGERAKQDDSLWANWTRTASIGIDSSLSDDDGDNFTALAELLAGSDPNDAGNTPAHTLPQQGGTVVDAVQGVIALVRGLDPGSFVPQPAEPGVLVDGPVWFCPEDDDDLCGGDGGSCDPGRGDDCVSLLFIGDPTATTHSRRALLQIDLGGDDSYTTEVAGPARFWIPGAAAPRAFGSTSIDLDGTDRYDTPLREQTQAYATGNTASLLLDLGGTDHYLAGRDSQASSGQGVALLIDFRGDDVYSAGEGSQAHQGGTGWSALLDLGGDDDYRFATQAASRIGPLSGALLLDAAGADRYNSTAIAADLATGQDGTLFATQGRVFGPASAAGGQQVVAFMDLGEAEDTYETLTTEGRFADVTARKNGVGVRVNRPPASADGAAAYFVDGAAALIGDGDGDSIPLLAELALGLDTDASAQKLAAGAIGSSNLTVAPDSDLAGRVRDLGYLSLPGLVVGSDLDNTYRDYVPFIVDLGGDDAYLAPSIGATMASYSSKAVETASVASGPVEVQLGTVAVLLDVEGDDTYRPATCSREFTGLGLATFEGTNTDPYGSGSVMAGGATQPALELGAEAYAFCPSLGGTATGVAILADNGGRNDFHSSTWVNATAMTDDPQVDRLANVAAWGVAQGSAAFSGVGILATWDARDTFSAELHVRAEETDLSQTPMATANGLAQGAAWGFGVGILASFGLEDDDYSSTTSAVAPHSDLTDGGLARGLSQGAALVGNGILLDEGGQNSFSAPDGYSQGFATLDYVGASPNNLVATFGLLWAGPGDDRYLGGDASHGAGGFGFSGVAPNGVDGLHSTGVLLDGGGNDVYTVGPAADRSKPRAAPCPGARPTDPAEPDCAFSQGASLADGLGLLVDLAGSDRYDAPGRTHVQAATLLGTASLLDFGGDDSYRAAAQAQAYVDAREVPSVAVIPNPGTVGDSGVLGLVPDVGPTPISASASGALLLDLGGRDAYTLVAAGQGYADGAGATARPLFVDAGGNDRYRYGGAKTAGSGQPDNGNNWTWASTPTAAPTEWTGIDSNDAEKALGALRSALDSTPAAPLTDLGSITLNLTRDPGRAIEIPDGGSVKGTIYAFATVAPADGLRVQRVDLLRDGEFMAVADPVPGKPDLYRFEWPTSQASAGVLDGRTSLVATAFLAYAEDNDRFATAPQAFEIESNARWLVVDNPPVASAALRTLSGVFGPSSLVEGQMAPGRHNATLEVTVGPDSDFPPGQPHNQSDLPGANVTVALRAVSVQSGVPPGTMYTFPTRYLVANTTAIRLDGSCPGSGTQWCRDGQYEILVTVTDLAGQTTPMAAMPLLIDRTPPVSRLSDAMPFWPEYANQRHQAGLFGLNVSWTSADGESGLGPSDVSGIRDFSQEPGKAGIAVLRLDANGTIVGEPHLAGPGSTSFPFQEPRVSSGDILYLLTVAQDALGNRESPCLLDSDGKPAEAEPCYRHKAQQPGAVKEVRVDFSPPVVGDVEMDRAIARPGIPLNLVANVSDEDSGLQAVELQLTLDNTVLPAIDLGLAPGAARAVTFAAPPAEGLEQRLDYVVWAMDVAGNTNELGGTVVIDSRSPEFGNATVAFRDGTTPAGAARPGGRAFVSVDVRDREVSTVNFTAPTLNITNPVACVPGVGDAWGCTVALAGNVTSGPHAILVVASDVAGNLNQSEVGIEVIGRAPEVLDASVVEIGSDFVEVRWRTDVEATDHLRFGKTGETRETAGGTRGVDGHFQRGLNHTVRVEGLLSGTRYFLRPEPHGLSNVENKTAAVLEAKTLPGYALSLPGFDGDAPWSGMREVTVGVEPRGQSRAPVSFSVRLQSPSGILMEGASLTAVPGVHVVSVDTAAFGDGLYRLNVTAERGGSDRSSILSGPFRIDNTAPILVASTPLPGAVSTEARPTVALVVIDPLNPALPPLGGLEVLLNGATAQPMNAGYRFTNGQRILSFDLERSLPSGHHELAVRLKDAAGNTGTTTWGFRVDGQAPDLHEARVAYEPGPLAGRPGGDVRVSVKLADGTGVAGVRVDLAPAGGPSVPLAAMGGTHWNGTLRLPHETPSGDLALPIRAADGLGNAGQVGVLRLVVDTTVPSLSDVRAEPANLTSASVTVATDEPTMLEALAPGGGSAKAATWEFVHSLTVPGLRPGQAANLTLVAVDGAGNVNRTTVAVAMPADRTPPTAPRGLRVVSPAEGVVELSWSSASDNAGVERYEVVRRVGDRSAALGPSNGTSFTDTAAPLGRTAVYEVAAIDVGGLRGPAATGSAKVLALPRLSGPSIEPRSGPSDQPFHVEVAYAHPAGLAPESIVLRYGDDAYPLLRSGPAGECAPSCTYEADVLLPPRSTLRAAPAVSILAQADGAAASVPIEAPLVTASGADLGVEAGGRDAPGLPGPAVALAILALLAAIGPSRRRPS